MARLSVASQWLVSALTALAFTVQAQGKEADAVKLTEKQASSAEFVAGWLGANANVVDSKPARWFFEQGLKEKKKGNWSAASKAFGESMIRFPDPRALLEHVNADLKMLGAVRARQAAGGKLLHEDMMHALNFYEASLAADGVTHSLSADDRATAAKNAGCIKRYLEFGKLQSGCAPLNYLSGEQ